AELSDERGKQILAGNRAAADDELPAHPSLELIDGLTSFARQREQALRVAEIEKPGARRDGAAAEPIQELDPEVVLEPADVLGHRRLSQVERFGGAREAPELGDLHEDLQPAQIHNRRGASWGCWTIRRPGRAAVGSPVARGGQ